MILLTDMKCFAQKKYQLIIWSTQVILSLIIIGAGFQLADNRSPAVRSANDVLATNSLMVDLETDFLLKNSTVCGPVDSCSGCLALQEKNPPQHCGFCEVGHDDHNLDNHDHDDDNHDHDKDCRNGDICGREKVNEWMRKRNKFVF